MKGGVCNPLTPPPGAAFACSKILTKSKSFSSISDSDMRRFKIMTRDMGPPPPVAGPLLYLEAGETELINTCIVPFVIAKLGQKYLEAVSTLIYEPLNSCITVHSI